MMLTRSTLFSILCLVALVSMAGCVGDDGPSDPTTTGTHIGNPGTLSFSATSALAVAEPGAPLTFVDDQGTAFELLDARMIVRDIKLDLPLDVPCADITPVLAGASCEEPSGEVVIGGTRVIDLVTATATPTLDDVALPPIGWLRVDFRLDEDSAGLVPAGDPLGDRSFFARARFQDDDGNPRTLELALRINDDLRIEAPGGVELPPGGVLHVELDVGDWLEGLPLAECLDSGMLTPDAFGVVRIDSDMPGACGDIEDAVEDNIKRSGRLRATEDPDDDA